MKKSTIGFIESTKVILVAWLTLNSTCSVNCLKSKKGINLSSWQTSTSFTLVLLYIEGVPSVPASGFSL